MLATRFVRRSSVMLRPLAARGALRHATTTCARRTLHRPTNTWATVVAGAALTTGVCLTASSAAAVAFARPVSVFELSDADAMLENAEQFTRQEAFDTLAAMNARDLENPKVMWRFARAGYELSGETKDKAEAKRLMEEAYAMIKKALELDNTDSDIHRWCGNILNGMSAFISTKESIANSYRIREHWEDAISVNPNDATAKALLGRWAYSVASLSWFKRNIAKALFGTPPVATYQEALEFFESAERTDPGFWMMNRVMIANTHEKLGNKEKALEWARKALLLPARSLDDKDAKQQAEALVKKLGGK